MKDVRKTAHDIQERIRELAYHMWEAAGRQQGIATEYWLAAEREVLNTMKTTAEKLMPSAKVRAQVEAAIAETWTKSDAKKPSAAPSSKSSSSKTAAAAPKKTATAKASPAPAAKSTKQPAAVSKAKAEPKKEPQQAGVSLESIEGIGPAYKAKLTKAGIHSPADLLAKGGTVAGRKSIVGETGIPNKRILKWVNMADLMRIPGVNGQYAELLEASGVDTVKELRNRNGDNLASTMKDVNSARNLTPNVPSAKDLAGWIDKAKKLEPMVTH